MNKITKIIIIVSIIIIVWNIFGDAKANNHLIKDELSEIRKQVAEYKKWVKINPKPYKVNFSIDGADWNTNPIIGDDSKNTIETMSTELKETIKPASSESYGDVYVNDVAALIFKQGNFIVGDRQNSLFPIGSIIVREKLIKKGLTDSFEVISLAVMIKHDVNFNPKSNGWQFLYLHPTNFAVTKNDQALCLSCHESKQANDFVFRSYLPQQWFVLSLAEQTLHTDSFSSSPSLVGKFAGELSVRWLYGM